jgi:arylsulfatase A-like enzyme
MQLFHRALADEPPEVAASAPEQRTVWRWRFTSPADLVAWRPHQIDRLYRLNPGGGLVMLASTDSSWLLRTVDFAAEEVDEIRVLRSPFGGDRVRLFWRRDEPAFTAENGLSLEGPVPDGRLLNTYVFRLRGHPGWHGRIRELRFDLTGLAHHHVALYEVEATKAVWDPGRFAAAVATPRRIQLAGQQQLARWAPPGEPWDSERLEIPVGGRLRFAYASEATSGPPVTFEVAFHTDDETVPLFSDRLEPEKDGGRWHNASVDLEALAGRRGHLRWQTDADPSYDLGRGLPLWGTPQIAAPTAPKSWNLLWIVVDTLRADRLSLYGYPRPTSPHLDRWAGEHAAVFSQAIAPAPWTLPSHVSMFTGLGPFRHGVNYQLPAPRSLRTLAEHLRDHGYATSAVTGGGYVRPEYGIAQGFDRFRFFGDGEGRSPGDKDLGATLAHTLQHLGGRPAEPFFLFVHTYQVHAPYLATAPWFGEFLGPDSAGVDAVGTTPTAPTPENGWQVGATLLVSGSGEPFSLADPENRRRLDALYDSGIRATDEALGAIFQQLAATGLDERTVVVLTSDHGESLGERGEAGHNNLYDETLRVPLVISWPDGRGRGQRIATQVRLIDLVPTLTESLGLPALDQAEGTSLLPLLDDADADFPAVAESMAGSTNRGVALRISGRKKLIVQHSLWRQGYAELFDLEADPRELRNLRDDQPEEARRLEEVLAARFDQETSNVVAEATNRSADALRIAMSGAATHALNAKGFGQPAEAFSWSNGAGLELDLTPGRTVRFYLDGHPRGEVRLTLAGPGGRPPLVYTLDLATLGSAQTFRWSDGWSGPHGDPLQPTESGLTLRWKGTQGGDGDAPERTPDAQLREQLEALGYVH